MLVLPNKSSLPCPTRNPAYSFWVHVNYTPGQSYFHSLVLHYCLFKFFGMHWIRGILNSANLRNSQNEASCNFSHGLKLLASAALYSMQRFTVIIKFRHSGYWSGDRKPFCTCPQVSPHSSLFHSERKTYLPFLSSVANF